MSKKVVVAGSTGLIGRALINKLETDAYFSEITSLVRYQTIKAPGRVHEKLINYNTVKELPKADTLVICLGTTRRKAGSKEAFRKVDYGYVIHLARLAEKASYQQLIVISSIGAKATSKNFYLRVKGEMEDIIRTVNISSKIILRPSLLLGKRNEFRLMESISAIIMKGFNPFLKGRLAKYKPVEDVSVAHTIIQHIKAQEEGFHIIESIDITM